ncbi:DUF2269 family protein [Bacillus sp. FJAT-50079]|uniref:DUF2269 family protein n=1 Tax=Bacillus sp. FJAT-50079 TaxID=2833577 RepID=UPI0032D5923C
MFYKILVFIHILSAILGMGPGFILSLIAKSAKTMTELRNAYVIKNRLHLFVMIGGLLLITTGLLMGAINPILFRMGWYVVSLLLFLIGLAMGPLLFAPLSKPIKELLKTHQGDEIPDQYFRLSKKLDLYENIGNGIFLVIIILMILKPF